MGAKIYQVSNPPGGVADPYSLDQAHQTAFCDAGDKVLGGGGTCPLCDAVGNPACAYGSFYIDHNSQAITQSGQEGWAYDCDLQGNNIDDATSTFVICLDLPPYR
jgi:hypothetical protein